MNVSSLLLPSTVVVRSTGLVDAEIDNEVVALNIESGNCYGLNAVGTRIWHLLGSPRSTQDICASLIAEYQVDPEVCERQVLDLLEELRAEGLVSVLEQR